MAVSDIFSMTGPARTFRFHVTSGAFDDGAQFSNITGFGATTDVVEYREGNDLRDTTIKVPGMVKYGNVTFKRGMTGDPSFIRWILGALPAESGYHGIAEPHNITIKMLDDGAAATTEDAFCTFMLLHAWPANLTLPDLNASSSEVAIETMEIVHEGLVFDDHSQPYRGEGLSNGRGDFKTS